MSAALMPLVNDLSRPFWAAARAGRLALPHCAATRRPFWPPSPTSPFRTGGAVEWHDVEAAGVLLGVVVYRRAFQTELSERLPYGIALVEVAPDARLFAHVAHPDTAPACGERVRVIFDSLLPGGAPVPMVEQGGGQGS